MLGISEPGALNFYTLFRLISLTPFVSRNLILIYISLSGFQDSLLCDLITPTPSLVFFLLIPHRLAAALSFSSGTAYPSLNFLPLSSLYSYSDCVGVNISLNNSSSLSFLNAYAPPLRCSPRERAEPTPFPSLFFPFSETSSFWGILTTITPTGTQKVFLIPWRAIAPLAVAPLLTSPSLPPLLLLGDALGSGF